MKKIILGVTIFLLLSALAGCDQRESSLLPADGVYFAQWDSDYTCTQLDPPFIQLSLFHINRDKKALPPISQCSFITTDDQYIQTNFTINLNGEDLSTCNLYTLAATLSAVDVGKYQIETVELQYADGTAASYDIGNWNIACVDETALYSEASAIAIGRHTILSGLASSYEIELTNYAVAPLQLSKLDTGIPAIDSTVSLTLYDDFIAPTKNYTNLVIPSKQTYTLSAQFT